MIQLVNFWVYYPDGFLDATYSAALSSVDAQTIGVDAQDALFSNNPGNTLRSIYVKISDLSDIVELREELQWVEQQSPQFVVAGMWDYATGEPIGGVGSPWFVTPPEVADFLPNGVIEDTILLAGQAKRKFV